LKKFFKIIIIIILSIILFFTLPWAILFVGLNFLPSPQKPAITYGEFPFRLEYEISGKRKVIKDTLICEYDGIGINEGQGKYRKWKEHFASGNERITLLKINNTDQIYYDVGTAGYYLGDPECSSYRHQFPDADYLYKFGKWDSDSMISAADLYEKFKIKLIKWEYTKPIKNKFT
jgi:hypothetical protein